MLTDDKDCNSPDRFETEQLREQLLHTSTKLLLLEHQPTPVPSTKCNTKLAYGAKINHLLLKHQPLPAQLSEYNEKRDEIKYKKVFTFGDKSCSSTWMQRTGKEHLVLRPSDAASVQIANEGRKCRKRNASCGVLQENDEDLEIANLKQKKVYHIPQQVQPCVHEWFRLMS
jgi:hypothetical protein